MPEFEDSKQSFKIRYESFLKYFPIIPKNGDMKRAKEITGYVAALSALKFFKMVIKRVESHQHHHEVREKFDSSCVKGAKKTTGGFPLALRFLFSLITTRVASMFTKKKIRLRNFTTLAL